MTHRVFRRIELGAVLTVLFLAGACNQNRAKDPACVGDACRSPAACVTTPDCEPNEVCIGGVCEIRTGGQPGDPCTTHTDCAPFFCNLARNKCVDCLNDDHCPVGQSCRPDGTCGDPSAGCVDDTDCVGLHCNTTTHQCVPCLTNAHCPGGQVCRNNACFTEGGTNPTCQSQADCDPYGWICNLVSHECQPCAQSTECKADYTCQNGRCTPATPPSGDGTCTTSAECGGQACFLGYCMPCFDDFMCMDLSDLLSGVSKICKIETGTCMAPECQTAVDCPAGQGCYGGGHCGECLANKECRTGEACVEGVCGNCTVPEQCDPGFLCSTEGRCVPPPPHTRAFGELCTGSDDCVAGLFCLLGQTSGICTRTCIGSGKGGDADCASGYACQDFKTGANDGLVACNAAAQLPANQPGQPFTLLPGASCVDGNACQTGICSSQTHLCARTCLANRDCNVPDEVCWAINDGSDALGGQHRCAPTDTTQWLPVGAACETHGACDTGLCMGQCSNGAPCDGWWDCLGTCSRQCRDHCRSPADCPADEACSPWPTTVSTTMSGWVPICREKDFQGQDPDGTSCTTDESCASDWCIGGICTATCAIAEDCTGPLAGKSCLPHGFADGNGQVSFSVAFCQ